MDCSLNCTAVFVIVAQIEPGTEGAEMFRIRSSGCSKTTL